MINRSEIETAAAIGDWPDRASVTFFGKTWTLSANDLAIKVQLAQWRYGWESIPVVTNAIQLRYSDLPDSADLRVPTPSGFTAMNSWHGLIATLPGTSMTSQQCQTQTISTVPPSISSNPSLAIAPVLPHSNIEAEEEYYNQGVAVHETVCF